MSNASEHPEPPAGQALTPSNEDICAYIAEICAELRDLAQRPPFRTINYLLDMARLEAERMGKEIRTSNNEAKLSGERH